MPTINGNKGQPAPKQTEIDFDPVRGMVVTEHFEGSGDNLTALNQYCVRNRIAFRHSYNSVKSSLVRTFSGAQAGFYDAPQINWELVGNEIQKSIFEHPVTLNALVTYPNLVKHVRTGYAMLEQGDFDFEFDFRAEQLDVGEEETYQTLIDLMQRGQTHYSTGQYVLRRSYTVSNFYNGEIPSGGYQGVVDTGSIINSTMPPVMVTMLQSIPVPANHDHYRWGWRALPSRMVTTAQNRVEISTEWWFEEWSNILYP